MLKFSGTFRPVHSQIESPKVGRKLPLNFCPMLPEIKRTPIPETLSSAKTVLWSLLTSDTKLTPNSRFNFTKNTLNSLPLPPSGRTYYNDSKVRGLRLTVFHTGTRTFQLSRWIVDAETGRGMARRIDIGQFPDLTIEQARAEAQRLNGLIAQGINPAAEKAAKREELTLEELVEDYFKENGYAATKENLVSGAIDVQLPPQRTLRYSQIESHHQQQTAAAPYRYQCQVPLSGEPRG